MDTMLQFQYPKLQTLTSVRVILLHHGQFHEQLECSVVSQELERVNKLYEAVSYVWGSHENKATISCNNASFQVTRNLEAFLRRFRYPSDDRVLWVDSICIDQSNLTELSLQVKLMGDIYRRAWFVVVWMGEEEHDSNFTALLKGVDLLYNLFPRNEEIMAWTDIGRGSTGPVRNYENVQAQFGLPAVDAEEFKALDKFWRNPWFNRAWTFQESILAPQKRFYFGQHYLTDRQVIGAYLTSVMLNFATDAEIFFNATTADNMTVLAIGMESSNADEVESMTDLLCLLYKRRGAQCHRPCDVVYSLLGLITNTTSFELDYVKDFGYVFAEVTMDIINDRGDLNVFNQARLSTHLNSDLPSWVPDWRLDREAYQHSKAPFNFGDIHLYRCTGSSKPHCSMSPDGKRLTVYGQEADRIYCLGELGDTNELKNLILQHLDFPVVNGQYMYTSNEPLPETLVRILCCDINYPEHPKRGYGERWTQATQKALLNILTADDNGTDLQGIPALHVRMRDQVRGCQWMISDGGRIGIAPQSAQVGDIITLMHGGRVPLLLRESGKVFTFVGECFVDQIMDGELFSKQYLLPPRRDFVLI